jgi:hypothetical protein
MHAIAFQHGDKKQRPEAKVRPSVTLDKGTEVIRGYLE